MRKVLISLAAAGAALGVATPAAAQYYPAPPVYGAPYGNAYGYNNYGQVRALQVRINQIQRQIENLRDRRMISRNEANGLRSESRELERRLAYSGRNGLNYNELRNIEVRIARLEQHVRHEVRDGNGWNGRNGYNAYDRDRDGRDDRYEDDRGRRHD
jgi:hypothetical protein